MIDVESMHEHARRESVATPPPPGSDDDDVDRRGCRRRRHPPQIGCGSIVYRPRDFVSRSIRLLQAPFLHVHADSVVER